MRHSKTGQSRIVRSLPKRVRQKRRRCLLESLESRQLLSANPLTSAQKASLQNDLSSLESFASHVESISALSDPLPLMDQTLLANLDVSDVLRDRLITPVTDFIESGSATLSSDDVANYIFDELSGTFAGVDVHTGPTTGTDDSGELVFDTSFYANRTVLYTADLGEAGESLGLRMTGQSDSEVSFGFKLDFKFGVDASGEFFAAVDEFTMSAVDAIEVVADDPMPGTESITGDVSLTLLLNGETSVTFALPASTEGNETPLVERVTAALASPLEEAGFASGVVATDNGGRLSLRAVTPAIQSMELTGDAGISMLGFSPHSLSRRSFAPRVEYGLLELEAENAVITIDASLQVAAEDGGDGRLSAAELAGSPDLASDAAGAAKAHLPVRPTFEGEFIASSPSIAFANPLAFGVAATSVTLDEFHDLDFLHEEVELTLRDGFAAVGRFAERLETETDYANAIPTFETSTASLVDLGGVLRTKLQQPVNDLLDAESRPSWERIRETLEGVPGVTVTGLSKSADAASIELALTDSRQSIETLGIGDAVIDAGLMVDDSELPSIDLTSTLTSHLQIDVDRRRTATPLESFAVRVDQLDTHVMASESLDFAGRVGLLDVSIGPGSANLAATLSTTVGASRTAGELIDMPISTLAATSSSGGYALELPVVGSIGGQTLNASLVLPPGDVFDGSVELEPVSFDTLEDFRTFASGDLVGGVEQFSRWLADYSAERLDESIPLADQTDYRDAISLQQAFEKQVTELLKDDDGMISFSSAQGLQDLLPSITGVRYDAANSLLLFDVAFDQAMEFQAADGSTTETKVADLGFDLDLGDLADVETQASVALTAGVSAQFQLGIDLRPLGHDATSITNGTPLSSLNDGMGVLFEDGDDVEIGLRDGRSFRVNFGDAATIGDVISAVESARQAAGISSSEFQIELREVDSVSVGFRLTDSTSDQGIDFKVTGVDGSLAGLGLGIAGTDEDGDGVIEGHALHGDTFAKHLFIQPLADTPILEGKVELAQSDFSASANLGFVEVAVENASFADTDGMPSHVTAAVHLVDPSSGNPVDRVTLADLLRSFDDVATVSARAAFEGKIDVNLPVAASVAGQNYSGVLHLSIADFGDALNPIVTQQIDQELSELSELHLADVLDGLLDGLGTLLDLDSESEFSIGLPVLDAKLPDVVGLADFLADIRESIDSIGSSTLRVIGEELERIIEEPISLPEFDISLPSVVSFLQSMKELVQGGGNLDDAQVTAEFRTHFDVDVELPTFDLEAARFDDFTDAIGTLVERLELADAGSLQQLESVLESALGLSSDAITLSIDTTQGVAARFDLLLDKTASKDVPLQLDLEDLGLSGVGDLVDVSGSSMLNLSVGAAAALSLGLDLSANGVTPFLYDFDATSQTGTRMQLSAGASANDIGFEASLGPLGIAIVAGSAGVNVSGVMGDSTPASFTVRFEDSDADGRIPLGGPLHLETSAVGGAFATFPIEIPTGNPVTTLNFAVTDLTTSPDDTAFNVNEVRAAIEQRIEELRSSGIGTNLLSMVGGWEGAFDLLIDSMRGEVLGVPLPLIGDALADEADFLEDIKQSVLDNIRDVAEQGVSVVQTGIFDALGPGGLDLLQDANGDNALTRDDVVAVIAPTNDRVDFDVHLRKAVEQVELPVDFDLGLPGLNLDVDAGVDLSFGADFRLGFGASIDEGFFIDTDTGRTQLEVFFDADVPDLSASGELALLDLVASTIPGSPTGFDGSFVVHLSDQVVGDGNGLLAVDEMLAGNFSDVIEHTLAARADVDLNLVVTLGDNSLFPRLRTDLIVDWEFIAGQELNSPEVSFENVEMNLGDFFGGFAGELLEDVQDILEPVQPVIDVLTQRLPVISDLSGSNITLVDLARQFGRADIADFAQAVIDINDLIVGLPEVGPETWIDLGRFGLAPDALGGFGGPDSMSSGTPGSLKMTSVQQNSDPLGQVNAQAGSAGSQWTNNLQNAKGSLRFPLLESPLTAFQLLIGQDVDLFLYDAPALGLDFTYSQFFPIPPIPILGAELAGRIAAVADFAFGFDTTGISKFNRTGNFVDVFDGFYVSDRANADGTGADVPEVYLRGSLTAGAKVNLLVAEAGVRGGIFAGVDFNLHDNDQDGRVRGNELRENLDLGAIHVFDVSGAVDAGLVAFIDVNLLLFRLHEEFEIARVNLLDL